MILWESNLKPEILYFLLDSFDLIKLTLVVWLATYVTANGGLLFFSIIVTFHVGVSSQGGSKAETNGQIGPLYFSGRQISNLSIRMTSFLPLKGRL